MNKTFSSLFDGTALALGVLAAMAQTSPEQWAAKPAPEAQPLRSVEIAVPAQQHNATSSRLAGVASAPQDEPAPAVPRLSRPGSPREQPAPTAPSLSVESRTDFERYEAAVLRATTPKKLLILFHRDRTAAELARAREKLVIAGTDWRPAFELVVLNLAGTWPDGRSVADVFDYHGEHYVTLDTLTGEIQHVKKLRELAG